MDQLQLRMDKLAQTVLSCFVSPFLSLQCWVKGCFTVCPAGKFTAVWQECN